MKIFGLATNPFVQKYLEEVRGFTMTENDGIPLYKNKEGYFLGGHRSFYTLIKDTSAEEINEKINLFRKKYKNIQTLISTPFKLPGSTLVNYVFDTRGETDPEERYERYEKKTRNLVKKSYKNDFNLVIGEVPEEFYKLYEESLDRLGGISKLEEWFKKIEESLKDGIVTFSLFNQGKLIAANYCILSEDYVFLMFNISDPDYWEYAVNDRLYDELIRWAIVNSYSYIDFGPGVASDSSHNHFKAGFGADRWYILNRQYGGFLYRFRGFLRIKRHNLGLRIKRFKANK